jgi:hypothetical protein
MAQLEKNIGHVQKVLGDNIGQDAPQPDQVLRVTPKI